MTDGAILDFFCQFRLMPTLLRETTLLFYYLTFKEDKTTDKVTFALHGHGSALYDQTIYPYRKSNKGGWVSITTALDSEHAECGGIWELNSVLLDLQPY